MSLASLIALEPFSFPVDVFTMAHPLGGTTHLLPTHFLAFTSSVYVILLPHLASFLFISTQSHSTSVLKSSIVPRHPIRHSLPKAQTNVANSRLMRLGMPYYLPRERISLCLEDSCSNEIVGWRNLPPMSLRRVPHRFRWSLCPLCEHHIVCIFLLTLTKVYSVLQ